MTLVPVQELFDVCYGVNLDLNKLEEVESENENAIRYVGRSEKNNGITAFVLKNNQYTPNPAMTISVAGGGSVMSSFLQEKEYYSGRDLFYLKPKIEMTKEVLLFYCTALRMNKFKFSYGRQANKSLETILVPSFAEIPDFVKNEDKLKKKEIEIKPLVESIKNRHDMYKGIKRLYKIFDLINVVSSNQVVVQPERITKGLIPYIRPSKWQSTSYAGFVHRKSVKKEKIFPAGTLYVSTDGAGSHTYSYVSIEEFIPNSNVVVLIPKQEMNLETKLLYAAYITANRFKFSYGRKPKGERLAELRLPVIK